MEKTELAVSTSKVKIEKIKKVPRPQKARIQQKQQLTLDSLFKQDQAQKK